MTINDLLKIIEILKENNEGMKFVAAESDCIYFPGDKDLIEMEEYCHWDSYYDCWCAFT